MPHAINTNLGLEVMTKWLATIGCGFCWETGPGRNHIGGEDGGCQSSIPKFPKLVHSPERNSPINLGHLSDIPIGASSSMSAFRASARCLAARIPSALPRSRALNGTTRSFAAVGSETPVWSEAPHGASHGVVPGSKATMPSASGVNDVLSKAVAAEQPRHDWTREEISQIYHEPLMELVHQAVSPLALRYNHYCLTHC